MAFRRMVTSWGLFCFLVLGCCGICYLGIKVGHRLNTDLQNYRVGAICCILVVWAIFGCAFAHALNSSPHDLATPRSDKTSPRQRIALYDNAKFLIVGFVVVEHFMVPVRSYGVRLSSPVNSAAKHPYVMSWGAGMVDGMDFYLIGESFAMALMAFVSGTGLDIDKPLYKQARNLWLLFLLYSLHQVLFNLLDYVPDDWHGELIGLSHGWPPHIMPIYHLWYLWCLALWGLITPMWYSLRYPVLTSLCVVFLMMPMSPTLYNFKLYPAVFFFFFFVLGADLRRRGLEARFVDAARKPLVRMWALLSLVALPCAVAMLVKYQWEYLHITPFDIIPAEMGPRMPSWKLKNINERISEQNETVHIAFDKFHDIVNQTNFSEIVQSEESNLHKHQDRETQHAVWSWGQPHKTHSLVSRAFRTRRKDHHDVMHTEAGMKEPNDDGAGNKKEEKWTENLDEAFNKVEGAIQNIVVTGEEEAGLASLRGVVGELTWFSLLINWLVLRVLMVAGCFAVLCLIPTSHQSWSYLGAGSLGSYIWHPVVIDLLQQGVFWSIVIKHYDDGSREITASGIWLLFCLAWIVSMALSTEPVGKAIQLMMWPLDRLLLAPQTVTDGLPTKRNVS